MILYKILKYLAFVIGAIGTVLLIWVLSQGDSAIEDSADLQSSILNPFLYLTYFIIGLTVLSVLAFVIMRFLTENVKVTLISLGIFAVIFLIAFVSSSGEAVEYPSGASISGTGAKWISTGLTMFYILGAGAVVALLVSSLKKLTFKN